MHSYLRAIGFSKIKKEADMEKLLDQVYQNFDHRNVARNEHGAFLELEKEFGPDMGLMLCGDLDPEGFHRQYYFPYYKGSGITTSEEALIEKRVNGDSFSGVCEDGRVGVSLIYYLQNPAEYQKEQILNQMFGRNTSVTLSGLSLSGMILFPVRKTSQEIDTQKNSTAKRNQLISAAKNGDQEAMESLTIEDMDLYSMLSRRVFTEDVYSIVDTFFMPYGIECDQYQVMGNINYYTKVRNSITKEYVYQINIECNDLNFDICINEADLMGSPEAGRRFKGTIWLQGKINFE
jgi:hypothetical protein